MVDAGVKVLFCGEEFPAAAGRALTIGRSGDVEIDDNPYLHRSFLVIVEEGGLWRLSNVGSTLTVTVADDKGLFHAWLSPGARIPPAFNRVLVWFTAGPTTTTSRSSSTTRPLNRWHRTPPRWTTPAG